MDDFTTDSLAELSSCPSSSLSSSESSLPSSLSLQSRKRKYNPSWEKSFPWLQYKRESSSMICTHCKKAKASTVWASTGCEKLKKDSIGRHAHSAVHRQSVDTTQLQKNAVTVFTSSHEKVNDSFVVLFRNVYWLAKENVAILKATSLHDLAKFNGVSIETGSPYCEKWLHGNLLRHLTK